MKICLVNNLYDPYQRGGAENITKIIAQNLKKQNHNVFIITTKPSFSSLNKKEQEEIYFLNSFYFYLNRLPLILRFVWLIFNNFNLHLLIDK